jgi:hypothetical protein
LCFFFSPVTQILESAMQLHGVPVSMVC